jgi:hypothetical protein
MSSSHLTRRVIDFHLSFSLRKPSAVVMRARFEDSTSNLKRHVTDCSPEENSSTALMSGFAHGSTYSPQKLRFIIAMWCSARNRPFHLVQDPEFQELLRMFNVQVSIPSRITVSRDIHRIFDLTKEKVKTLLQSQDSALHLGIDGWTSPNHFSFIGITVHSVANGSLFEFTLDFAKMTKTHSGVHLAHRVREVLRDFGIEDKVSLIDNFTSSLPSF